jgi:hypothetical protein
LIIIKIIWLSVVIINPDTNHFNLISVFSFLQKLS